MTGLACPADAAAPSTIAPDPPAPFHRAVGRAVVVGAIGGAFAGLGLVTVFALAQSRLPPGKGLELFAMGSTPLNGTLRDMKRYFESGWTTPDGSVALSSPLAEGDKATGAACVGGVSPATEAPLVAVGARVCAPSGSVKRSKARRASAFCGSRVSACASACRHEILTPL